MTRLVLHVAVLLVLASLANGVAAQPSAKPNESHFERLSLAVNTPDRSELLPVISADGKTLYFTRTRLGMDNGLVFDVWRSSIDSGKFSNAEFVGGPLASHAGVAVTSVAPDNNTLYVIGKLTDDALPEERLHVTHRTVSGWSMPEALHIRNLHAYGTYTDYSFGPNQHVLLMSVDRDSSLGGRDLYVSFLDEKNSSWSSPRWLGPAVNSRFTEMTPYLASDNRTLYFSSDRPGGIGEVDVYRTHRLDDSWQNWSPVENLGPEVNRAGRTTYYTEDASGQYAYMSWKGPGERETDIYRVKVSHQAALALVHGLVTDDNSKPLAARIRYERLSDGQELGTARSNPTTGEYQISLPAGEDYTVRAERDGYFPTSERIDLSTLKVYASLERNLKLSRIESGATVTLKNVFFETDKAMLLPASFTELDRVVILMKDNPKVRLEIGGHTDNTGSEAHNQQLARDRAEAVKAYILTKGIEADRVASASFGSSKPVANNDTEEGRAQNRRVEFIVK